MSSISSPIKLKNDLPVTAKLWFDDRNYRDNPIYKSLSEEDMLYVDSMHTNGYVIVKNSVSDEVIDSALKYEKEWILSNKLQYEANRKQDGTPPRIVDFHRESQEIVNLFTKNKSVALQDALFQSRTSIYTSLFFATSTQQPMHRDVPVFRTSPANHYFGMWVALEDADINNGTLKVYSGGHKISVDQFAIPNELNYDKYEIPQQSNELWNAYQERVFLACKEKDLKIETLDVKKGDTVIWHPLLPHSGGKIVEPGATRYSIVFHTVPEGTPVYRANVFFNSAAQNVTNVSRFNYVTIGEDRYSADFGGCKLRNR